MKAMRLMMTAAVVAAMAGAGVATAQGPGGHGPGHGPGHGGPGFGMGPMAGLDLTDAQREQMKALHEKRRATLEPLMTEARTTREAFERALAAESPDPTAVGEAALAMKAAREKMHAAHEAAAEEVEKILTAEQREQLAQRAGRHGGRGFGGHHGGPSGPPPVEQ